MIKNKISLLLTTCLMHIITIEIFSQDCCKNICYCCKDICCGCLYNNNKKSEEEGQEQYFDDLLKDFDKNIKKFNDSIFSENPDSTDAEYTIVKDGTESNKGILGKGSFGTVYKVKNKKGKFFALKKIFILKDAESVTKKEIQTLIKCRKCENVIKIVDAYKKDGIEFKDGKNVDGFYYYIITELYDHGDLSDIRSIDDIKSNNIKRYYIILRRIIYQMINAVKQVHDKGIIHCDISPFNFFIGKDYNLYLGDFGCATEQYDGGPVGDHFYSCSLLVHYLKEKGEELKHNKNFNKLYKFLDIFALATSIFHLLTGDSFWSLISSNDLINENITADEKWKIINDRSEGKDISKKLSIFRYTAKELNENNDLNPDKWQEPDEYKKLDSDFVDILKKVLLESNFEKFEKFDVVTIDDLTKSDFYKGLKLLVEEEKDKEKNLG